MIVKIKDPFGYRCMTFDIDALCELVGKRFTIEYHDENGYKKKGYQTCYPISKVTKVCNEICHAIQWEQTETDASELEVYLMVHNKKFAEEFAKARRRYHV